MLMHATDAETLNSIRLALGREEQQIRVNDSTSRETYDLTLSRSVPYASPIVSRTDTPSNALTQSSSASTGHKILRLPQLVSKRVHAPLPSPQPFTASSPLASSETVASSNGDNEKAAQLYDVVPSQPPSNDFTRNYPLVAELPPSPPLEADYITGRQPQCKEMTQILSSPSQQPAAAAGRASIALATKEASNGNLPKIPTPRRAYTTELGAMMASTSVVADANGAPADVIYAEPASTTDGAYRPTHNGHTARGLSDASTNSTVYRSAASHGSDSTNTSSPTTHVARIPDSKSRSGSVSPVPAILLTHDTTQYLHPDSSAGAGPSVRRPSASNGLANGAVPARQVPPRRNTTGSSLHNRRPPSASSLSQRSRRSSKDRDANMGLSFFGAEGVGLSSSQDVSSLALRTGDAAFDEEAAKHAEQLRRDRRVKEQKARDAAAATEQEGAIVEKEGGGALSALTRSKTGRDWRNNEEEKIPQVVVGNLIGEGHANYVLMYNMLTGIRIGVSRCQAKMKRSLTDADYSAKHKFTFDIIGNELTPSAKYDFKFKDYAPWVFRELREYFHLDAADYLLSLTSKYILSELGSPGKSGSFFYFSRDYRFIIKTIRHQEHKFLLRILKDYHEHIKANPHTLLSRFYGLHRVKLPHGRKIHFVIMNNLFPPHRDIHETYDLKGSSIGREYPEEKAATKKGAVMKDLNWLNRHREIELGPEKRALFEAQLKSDVELLQRLNIMDYSLLIGLHDMRRGNSENLRQDALHVFQPETNNLKRQPTQIKRSVALREAVRRSDPKALGSQQVTKLPDRDSSERRHFVFYQDEGGFRSTDRNNMPGDMIYYLGVIDLFTPYTTVKRGEHLWKGLTQNKHMISAVPPKEYGQRFINFLCSVVTDGDKSKRPKMFGH